MSLEVGRLAHVLGRLVITGVEYDEIHYSADGFKGTVLHLCGKTLHCEV